MASLPGGCRKVRGRRLTMGRCLLEKNYQTDKAEDAIFHVFLLR